MEILRASHTLRVPDDVVPGTEAQLWLNASTGQTSPWAVAEWTSQCSSIGWLSSLRPLVRAEGE